MTSGLNELLIKLNWTWDNYHKALAWAVIMCIILFFMMGIDKKKARNGRYRIAEKTLFLFAILGGAFGGWLGMRVFHHKTRHWYFRILFPVITVLWTALLLYIRTSF